MFVDTLFSFLILDLGTFTNATFPANTGIVTTPSSAQSNDNEYPKWFWWVCIGLGAVAVILICVAAEMVLRRWCSNGSGGGGQTTPVNVENPLMWPATGNVMVEGAVTGVYDPSTSQQIQSVYAPPTIHKPKTKKETRRVSFSTDDYSA